MNALPSPAADNGPICASLKNSGSESRFGIRPFPIFSRRDLSADDAEEVFVGGISQIRHFHHRLHRRELKRSVRHLPAAPAGRREGRCSLRSDK
jgi:hypothetical protein